MFFAVRFSQSTRAVRVTSEARSGEEGGLSPSSRCASARRIRKRGTLRGTRRNFCWASPRLVRAGSMKITARAPSSGALSQCRPELKSMSTIAPSTSAPLKRDTSPSPTYRRGPRIPPRSKLGVRTRFGYRA